MTNLVERLRTALRPSAYERMNRRARAYDVMRESQPYLWEQQGLFRELDSRMIDMLRRFKDYETVYGTMPMSSMSMSDKDRLGVVQRSRIWAAVDPLISHSIQLWTAYGFGQEVMVAASDERAQEVWDTFWVENDRVFGDRDIHDLSDALLTSGEIWLACYIALQGGDVTVRLWPTEQIVGAVTMEGDYTTPLWYRRQWNDAEGEHVKYYPDYQATPEELEKAVLPRGAEIASDEATRVVLMPVQFNRLSAVGAGWPRGWPLTTPSLDWAQAYRQFCEDRAAVARKIAGEVEEFKAKTGQRGIEAMAQMRQSALMNTGTYMETNPPAGAGSERWINDVITSKRLDMGTGAQDAATDSMLLLGQVATGMGLPAFMLGRTDMLQNRATSETAMRPTLRIWGQYQMLWEDVFADLFNLVLDAQEVHGAVRGNYPDRSVTVELSSPLDTDYEAIYTSIVQYWDRGVIQPSTLSRLAMGASWPNLSPTMIDAVMATMYPELQREADKQEVRTAILKAIAEGRVLETEDVAEIHEHKMPDWAAS